MAKCLEFLASTNVSLFLNPCVNSLGQQFVLWNFDRLTLNFRTIFFTLNYDPGFWTTWKSQQNIHETLKLNANWNKHFLEASKSFASYLKCSNPWRVRLGKMISLNLKYSSYVWNHFEKFEGLAWLKSIDLERETGVK